MTSRRVTRAYPYANMSMNDRKVAGPVPRKCTSDGRTITDRHVTGNAVLFVYKGQNYYEELKALMEQHQITVLGISCGGGWVRDEFFTTIGEDNVIKVVVPAVQEAKLKTAARTAIMNAWEKKYKNRAADKKILEKVTGTVGGQSIFSNSIDEYQARIDDLDTLNVNHRTCNFPLEGGNVINTSQVLPDGSRKTVLFIGEESREIMQLFEITNPEQLIRATLGLDPRRDEVVWLPQFMWHLDLFMVPLKPGHILLADIPPQGPSGKRNLFDVLRADKELLDNIYTKVTGKGFICHFVKHAIVLDPTDGKFNAVYTNGITFTDAKQVNHMVVLNFGSENNQKFLESIESIDAAISLHFVGDAEKNRAQLRMHGGALSCATNT